MRRWVGKAVLVVTIAALGACGPVEYTAVILDASQALAEAREADARTHAPYEYFYAKEHIHKAREEAGYADYQAAIELGRTAEQYATKARDIARSRRRELGR
jgi:hypothetical protein